jgi:hypothetical protein
LTVPVEIEPILIALMLGITTDYSIFFLSGLRRQLRAGQTNPAATKQAVGEYVAIVLTAGLTVAARSRRARGRQVRDLPRIRAGSRGHGANRPGGGADPGTRDTGSAGSMGVLAAGFVAGPLPGSDVGRAVVSGRASDDTATTSALAPSRLEILGNRGVAVVVAVGVITTSRRASRWPR